MADKFPFDEAYLAMPAEALEADPASTMRDLYLRIGNMERRLDEQEARSVADWRETLLSLVSSYDIVTRMMERFGHSPDPHETTGLSDLIAIGKQLLAVLQNHQVQAIETIGEPLDIETSDQAGSEERASLPPGIVVREAQIGYRWPHGLLRRAKVIVSEQPLPYQKSDATVVR